MSCCREMDEKKVDFLLRRRRGTNSQCGYWYVTEEHACIFCEKVLVHNSSVSWLPVTAYAWSGAIAAAVTQIQQKVIRLCSASKPVKPYNVD